MTEVGELSEWKESALHVEGTLVYAENSTMEALTIIQITHPKVSNKRNIHFEFIFGGNGSLKYPKHMLKQYKNDHIQIFPE